MSGVGQPAAFAIVVLAEDIAPEAVDARDQGARREGARRRWLTTVNAELVGLRAAADARGDATEPWTIENGMLTPTMKLKRAKIEASSSRRSSTAGTRTPRPCSGREARHGARRYIRSVRSAYLSAAVHARALVQQVVVEHQRGARRGPHGELEVEELRLAARLAGVQVDDERQQAALVAVPREGAVEVRREELARARSGSSAAARWRRTGASRSSSRAGTCGATRSNSAPASAASSNITRVLLRRSGRITKPRLRGDGRGRRPRCLDALDDRAARLWREDVLERQHQRVPVVQLVVGARQQGDG